MASSKVERKKTVEELRQIEGVESIESDPITKKLKEKNDQKMQIVLYMSHIMIIYVLVVELTNFLKESNFVFFCLVYALWYGFTGVAHKDRNKSIAKHRTIPIFWWVMNFVHNMVANQLGYEFTGIAPKALDKSVVKKTHDCYRNQNHELELKRYNKRFTCDGCKEDGFGYRYRCEQCDYELHEDCKFPKTTISPKLFQGSTFEFRENSYYKGQERCCDACGKYIYGYSYHCKANDLDLHPRCSNLKDELSVNGTVVVLRDKKLSKCMWCGKRENSGGRVPGCSYVSACERYQFHVDCINEMEHEVWKKGATDDTEDTSMALKQVNLQLMGKNPTRNGGRGRDKFLKTLKIFIGIISICLGDPTALIASTVVGLLSN